jgi:hypothetical protein
VEFNVDARVGGASKWNVAKLVRLAGEAIISFSSLPLKVIHLASAMFLIFAVVIGSRALYLYARGVAVGGATTIVILILGAGGLGLGCLAVIAEYLAAIYDEVKGRPRYVVSSRTRE